MPQILRTPKDEVDAYANISVPLESGGTYTVSVTKYRCGNTAFGKDPQHGGIQDALVFKDKMLGASKNAIVKALGAREFVGVFSGKGALLDIIAVLQWCDKLDLLNKKLSKQQALQQICDDYIGLDCNGYAVNWLNDNWLNINIDTPPASLGPLVGAGQRKALEDIQAYDLFTWSNHVAVVEDIGPVVGDKLQHRVGTICEAFGAIMCQDRMVKIVAKPTAHFSLGGHGGTATVWSSGLVAPTPVAPTPQPAAAGN